MMAPDKLIGVSSSPPICSNWTNASNGINNTCQPKENNSSPTVATMLYTRLRKHFSQIRNPPKYAGRHYQYEKLGNNISKTTNTTATEPAPAGPAKPTTGRRRLNSLLSLISITTLILSTFITAVTANPVFVDNPELAQFQSGRNIRHLPCIVRKSGRSGVCMFAIDCIKQNGTHLGTCIDRFYFGSCCDIKEDIQLFTPEIGDNSIDQNTISHHFTSESTTMPTSALFKLTTLGPISSSNNTEQQVEEVKTTLSHPTTMINVQDTQRPSTQTTIGITTKPSKYTTTTRPQHSTTHKHSHFVVRTTAKPIKNSNTSKYTTTRRKTTTTSTTSPSTMRTTTTSRPMLTTTPAHLAQDEIMMENTTPPIKLFTFQTVETTVATPTEPTKVFDFVTTQRTQSKITRPPITVSMTSTSTKSTTTTTTNRPTTISTTTTTRTSTNTKPQITRKPITTKKPSQNKRTTTKPPRKPLPSIEEEVEIVPLIQNTNITAASTSSSPTTSSLTTSTESTIGSSTTSHKTTSGLRPRPKPTATITKVPKPTITSTKGTHKPSTSASETTDTEEMNKQNSDISTSTTSSTTLRPLITKSSITTTISTTTTTTTPIPTTIPTSQVTTISTTSIKPGLVTWTNVDAEPASPDKPSLSDWIPVTTAVPIISNNTTVSTTVPELNASEAPSANEVVSDNSIFEPQPEKPIVSQTSPTWKPSITNASKEPSNSENITTSTSEPSSSSMITTQKPIRTTTTKTPTTEGPKDTTSTELPSSTENSTTHASTSTTYRPLSTATTTEIPIVSFTTDMPLNSTDIATEVITTEVPAVNVTTPVNSLEGVDYRQVCGRRMFPEPRIVGGSNAAFGRWPWQISLRQWRTSTYLHKCGAALLNENWAITAAHCVDNVPPSDLLLRLGEYDLAEEEEPYGYQERRVQIVASHPQFDPRTFEYDLALLRFYEPVTFQPNIIPVCVPDSDENFIGQTAFVTGWGRLYEDGPLPSVLQEVAVPVINNTICESMYRSAGYIEHIPHIFICAGWKKGGYDSCEGDSGGPMVLQRESDKRFQLGGVISWGIGCAEANQPGVYTRISEFRDWINQILQF